MSKNLIKIIKLIAPFKWWMILAIFVGFLTVGSGIGLLMTSAYIIAKAALHPDIGQLQVGIVGVRFFGITRGLFRYAERLLSHNVTFSLLAKFRVWFFKSIEPLFPKKMGEFSSGDLLTRVVSDVESLEHIFIRVISPPLIAMLVLLVMVIILAEFSLSLLLPFLIPFLAAAILVPFITYRLSAKYGDQYILLRSQLAEMALDGIDGKNELIAFGLIENHKSEFALVNKKLIGIERNMKLIDGMNESLIGLLMNFAILFLFIEAGGLAIQNNISGVSISVITLGAMASFEVLFAIPQAVQHLKSSLKASERIFQITDQKTEASEVSGEMVKGNRVEIKNVSFGYSENKEVLEEIFIKADNNQKVAIIGGSGAGKSSIINLLLKFWEANSGSIFMNEILYSNLSQTEIISNIAVIPQKVFLFSNTIKENLLIANPKSSDEELWDALFQAELSDLVKSLPDKLETWIGNQGKQLSGGEKKRIAIARAILKRKDILICDEITADLDSINEEKIINTIHKVSENKSLIYITHRLVDLEKFDLIYLLEKGKIISVGKHEELLGNSKEYRSFFQ